MKKLFLVLSCFIYINTLKAQSEEHESSFTTKSVYVELLGSGLISSINFDSRFKGPKGLGYRIGIGYVPLSKSTTLTFPVGVNAIFGKKNSFFEAELTGTVITNSNGKFNGNDVSKVFVYPHIGYRYSQPRKSFIGRVYIGPMIYGKKVLPYPGLSLGYTL